MNDEIQQSPQQANVWENSTLAKYGRYLLLSLTALLAIFFSWKVAQEQIGTVCLLQSIALVGMLIWTRGHSLLRVGILMAMALNLASIAANADYLSETQKSLPYAAVFALLGCTAATIAFECSGWIRPSTRGRFPSILYWILFSIPAIIYIVVIPATASIFESENTETIATAVDPNWHLVNECSFRAAKFAVFAAFTFLGACLGSFLNVVAYSLPRGKHVGLRDSICPQCHTKISRFDNLPIFSYLNLGGQCRSCSQSIPIRYLAVEMVAGLIFGSLFLYQLVAGCWNIPEFKPYLHTGILWMILYPKWPAIGLYFLHAFYMLTLLTLALVEWDKQKLKLWQLCVLLLCFAVVPIVFPPLQPLSVTSHFPWNISFGSKILAQVAASVAGSLLGFLVGFKFGRMAMFAFAITGVVVGWQGLLQVLVLFAIIETILLAIPTLRKYAWQKPTAVLLAAAMLHHPFWKILLALW